MMKRFTIPPAYRLGILITWGCASLVTIGSTALAAPRCPELLDFQNTLLTEFGERASAGAEIPHGLVVVYINQDTHTFTMAVIKEDGTVCPFLSGDHWRDSPVRKVP